MLVDTETGDVALPFEALSDAKLVLTDALIEASLKAQHDKGFDPTLFDEIETAEHGADEDDETDEDESDDTDEDDGDALPDAEEKR